MSDTVKLIIEMPKDVYTRLFDNGIQDNEIAVDDVCEMARSLRIGTPLDRYCTEHDLVLVSREMFDQLKIFDTLEDAIDSTLGIDKVNKSSDPCTYCKPGVDGPSCWNPIDCHVTNEDKNCSNCVNRDY